MKIAPCKELLNFFPCRNFALPLQTGKSYTTSSPRIPQVLTEARVSGRSGAM